jgi:hypothetical protein
MNRGCTMDSSGPVGLDQCDEALDDTRVPAPACNMCSLLAAYSKPSGGLMEFSLCDISLIGNDEVVAVPLRQSNTQGLIRWYPIGDGKEDGFLLYIGPEGTMGGLLHAKDTEMLLSPGTWMPLKDKALDYLVYCAEGSESRRRRGTVDFYRAPDKVKEVKACKHYEDIQEMLDGTLRNAMIEGLSQTVGSTGWSYR